MKLIFILTTINWLIIAFLYYYPPYIIIQNYENGFIYYRNKYGETIKIIQMNEGFYWRNPFRKVIVKKLNQIQGIRLEVINQNEK